jgi:DNA-binding transcriptional LysR family regulator
MVSKGILDFAFITTPFSGGNDLEVYKISKLNDILIAPISMKNEIKSPLSFKSLAKYPFILLSKDMQYRQFIDDFLAKHSIHINPVYETDSSAILPPFVELGYGLTFIPDEMAKKSIEEGKCYKVDILEELPNRYIAFVIKKDKNHSNIIYEIKQAILKENK